METKQKNVEKDKKKIKRKHIIRRIILVVLLILSICAGVFAYRISQLGGGVHGIIAATLGHNLNTKENLEPITFLALGKSQNLTDTIMVCYYDPQKQEAAMISIPRDTFTGSNKNKATASQKLNALYQISPQKTLDAVNKITGLNIKYYATIDTKSLREIVDSVGGIYYDVPMDMKYDDVSQNLHINLKKGYQLLNGDKAEQLVRFRHGNDVSKTYPSEYGEQDLGRMKTQRQFLVEAGKQVLQLKNVLKVGELVEIAKNNLETNIPIDLIKDYIPYAIELDMDSIRSEMLPGEPEKCNGVWLYVQNKEESKQLLNDIFERQNEKQKVENQSISIEILNGSGNKNNLTKVTKLLQEKGYNIIKSDTTTITSKTTIINRTNQSEEIESYIKNILGTGNITTGNENNDKTDFTIIIGKDCKIE